MSKVKLDPETIGTIFDEIALNATQTVKLQPAFVGQLDCMEDFDALCGGALEQLGNVLLDADARARREMVYGPLVDLCSGGLLWLLWLRQQGRTNQYRNAETTVH